MSTRYDCNDPAQREAGIEAAVEALRGGGLVVMPTDTVYGISADAFTPRAVSMLLAAKGRGRNMPPPVLVGTVRAANALVEGLGAFGQDLIDEFWPGPLTLVFRAAPTLQWDLGDTMGTVAVRMPLHPVALEVLKQAGPTAVSSANLTGSAAATTAADAEAQLGASVSVYLDGGPCASDIPSTILDLTGSIPRVLRAGAISVDRLRKVAAIIDDTSQAEPAEDVKPAADVEPAEDVKPANDVKPAEPHPLAGAASPPPTAEAPAPAPDAATSKSTSTRAARAQKSPGASRTSTSSRAAGTPKTSRAAGTRKASSVNGTSTSSRAGGTSKASGTDGTSTSSRAGGTSRTSRAAGTSRSSSADGTSARSRASSTPRSPRATGTSSSSRAAGASKSSRNAGTSASSQAADAAEPTQAADTPQPPADAG